MTCKLCGKKLWSSIYCKNCAAKYAQFHIERMDILEHAKRFWSDEQAQKFIKIWASQEKERLETVSKNTNCPKGYIAIDNII